MMRAVHFVEAMRRLSVVTQRLNVVIFHLRKFVAGNIELERAAKRDVQNLHSFANGEDREAPREDISDRCKFPAVPFWIDIFFEHGRIGHRLSQKFRRDIGAAGEKQTIHLFHRHLALARIANANVGLLGKKWLKPFLIFFAHPGGKVGHTKMSILAYSVATCLWHVLPRRPTGPWLQPTRMKITAPSARART